MLYYENNKKRLGYNTHLMNKQQCIWCNKKLKMLYTGLS